MKMKRTIGVGVFVGFVVVISVIAANWTGL
jgi:hypothetical protein